MRRLALLAALLPALAVAQPAETPVLYFPTDGQEFEPQSFFEWVAVEGATAYRLQIVAQGGSFDRPLFETEVAEPEESNVEARVFREPLSDRDDPFGPYRWRVAALDADGQGPWSEPDAFEYLFIADAGPRPPEEALALAVWPLPAASSVSIRMDARASMDVRVEAFDALGRRVAVLREGPAASGATWAVDVRGWAPGVYVVRAIAGAAVTTTRVVVVR